MSIFESVMDWIEDSKVTSYNEGPRWWFRWAFVIVVSVLLAGLSVGLAGLSVGIVVWSIDRYFLKAVLAFASLALYPAYRFIVWLFDIKKGTDNGSDRETEEDSQDSSPSASGSPGLTYYDALARSIARSLHTSTGLTPAVEEKPPRLEQVESDLPILAHRSALLRFDATDKPFGSVNPGWATFGVDADAACQNEGRFYRFTGEYDRHDSPDIDCGCGFYALPPDLEATYEGPGFVTLMVELSGTVIEHDKGYRAGHQRVIECKLPACPYCGQQADVLTVADHVMQQATCRAHVPVPSPGQVFIEADALADLIPVPIVRAGRVQVQS